MRFGVFVKYKQASARLVPLLALARCHHHDEIRCLTSASSWRCSWSSFFRWSVNCSYTVGDDNRRSVLNRTCGARGWNYADCGIHLARRPRTPPQPGARTQRTSGSADDHPAPSKLQIDDAGFQRLASPSNRTIDVVVLHPRGGDASSGNGVRQRDG